MCQICFKQIQIDTLFQQGNYIIEHTFFQLFTSAYYTASEPFSVFWTQFREHILTSYNFTLICLYYWL